MPTPPKGPSKEAVFIDLVRQLKALGATRVKSGTMEVDLAVFVAPDGAQAPERPSTEAEPVDEDDLLEWSNDGPLPSTRRKEEKPTDDDND